MAKERQRKLKEYIDQHGEATLRELAHTAGDCSQMTLWRDLKALEESGAIRRTRGGAVSAAYGEGESEGLYSSRAKENVEAKRLIAALAARYVLQNRSVYLDAGSTVMQVANILPDQPFTVITSGVNIAAELSQRRACNVIMVGGQVNGITLSASGAHAESLIQNVNIDIALMATSGYSIDAGFTSGSISEQSLKAKVIAKAECVIMLMDSGKLDRNMPFSFASMKDIDILITDRPLPQRIAEEAKLHDTQIVLD